MAVPALTPYRAPVHTLPPHAAPAAHQVQWGDVATWVGSISQALTLIAAVIAALVAYRLYKNELKRDDLANEDRRQAADDRRLAAEDHRRAEADRNARLDDQRRAQANKVAAWWTPRPVRGASIRNASELPIRDVRTTFYQIDRPHPVGPWDAVLLAMTTSEVLVIPPGGALLDRVPETIKHTIVNADTDSFAVGIEFTDAGGIRWERDPHGALKELT